MAEELPKQDYQLRKTFLANQDVAAEELDRDASVSPAAICQSNGYLVPGQVTFRGCSAAQLNDLAVIPEGGGNTFTPENNKTYSTEGFWWRHRYPKLQWFKISDSCVIEVSCGTDNTLNVTGCCKLGPGIIADWSTDKPSAQNPFKVALKAFNSKFVAAELGGGRELLVANRNNIGPWETFELFQWGANKIVLKAFNGKHVAAELGGGKELVANRNNIGPWEQFKLISLGGTLVALQADNNKFVAADANRGGQLIADRDAIGPLEKFELLSL